MATKNIVPNTDGEGQLGTSSKSWAQGHIDSITGTIATAAQSNITSLGTLTTLTVDNVIINGTTIGHTSDTDLLTLASASLTVAGNITLNVASDSNPRITFDGAAVDDGHFIQVNRSTEAMEFHASDVTVLTLDTSSVSTFAGNIKIPDSGTIGCAADADLLTLASGALTVSGSATVSGNISLTGSASNLNFSSSQDASITMSATSSGTDGRDLTIFAGASSNTDADNGGDLLLRSGNAGDNGSSQIKFITATASHDYGQQAEQMRIDSVGDVNIMTGNLVISTSGKGITFSATNSPAQNAGSGSSNTLDNYEEGTWTPVITFISGSQTFHSGSVLGQYTLVGRKVTLFCEFACSNLDGASNNTLRIDGIPFNVTSSTGSCGYGVIPSTGKTLNFSRTSDTRFSGNLADGGFAGIANADASLARTVVCLMYHI